MPIMPKKHNVKREIMHWIIDYYTLRDAYLEKLSRLDSVKELDGMPRSNGTTNDVCANKAITIIELEHEKEWLTTVELMETALSEKTRKFLELRRDAANQIPERHKRGRPNWTGYVQANFAEWFFNRYNRYSVPSRETMDEWMDKIVNITAGIAIGKGIFKEKVFL